LAFVQKPVSSFLQKKRDLKRQEKEHKNLKGELFRGPLKQGGKINNRRNGSSSGPCSLGLAPLEVEDHVTVSQNLRGRVLPHRLCREEGTVLRKKRPPPLDLLGRERFATYFYRGDKGFPLREGTDHRRGNFVLGSGSFLRRKRGKALSPHS